MILDLCTCEAPSYTQGTEFVGMAINYHYNITIVKGGTEDRVFFWFYIYIWDETIYI